MSEKTTEPAPAFEDFFTRQRANDGVELPLALPNGTKTDFWIRVRGTDSDIFRAAQAASRRRMFEIANAGDKVDFVALEESEKLEQLCALVAGWNLPKEFTPENVRTFLIEAPQIGKQIDVLTAKRNLFFAHSLKPSTSTPASTSS